MKSILALLFSFTLFAQNPYPDTLFLKDGRSFPCLVMDINESRVGIDYSSDIYRSTILEAVQRISLEKLGTIYLSDFIIDLNIIEDYVDKRLQQIEYEKMLKEEEKLDSITNTRQITTKDYWEKKLINGNSEDKNRWSFGVFYVPYYSGTVYRVVRSSSSYYPSDTYKYSINETNMEAQLTYEIVNCVKLTLDIGYNSTYTETRYENHENISGSSYNYGSLEERGLKLFDITFGLKYYFFDLLTNNVSVYALAGVGQQFAFSEDKYENLYPQGTQVSFVIEDNMEEYQEDLNSPWHFNIGFGAEYFFNESLSLTSNIRFLYSEISGKYNYKYIQGTEIRTRTEEYNNSEFITRVGLGLNFYF